LARRTKAEELGFLDQLPKLRKKLGLLSPTLDSVVERYVKIEEAVMQGLIDDTRARYMTERLDRLRMALKDKDPKIERLRGLVERAEQLVEVGKAHEAAERQHSAGRGEDRAGLEAALAVDFPDEPKH